METTANGIIKKLRSSWPGIQFNWIPDSVYVLPQIAEIEKIIPLSGVASLHSDGEFIDCDDYALLLNAFIKRYRIDNYPSESYHWAFGEVFGTRFNGIENIHSMNVCIAQEGIFLVEPQTYEVRLGSAEADEILLVKL